MSTKIKNDVLVMLIMSGASQKEIADKLNCTEATISRRVNSPEFKELIAKTRNVVLDSIVNELYHSSQIAIRVLKSLLDDSNSSIKLQAASKILSYTQEYGVQADLMREVEELKDIVKSSKEQMENYQNGLGQYQESIRNYNFNYNEDQSK